MEISLRERIRLNLVKYMDMAGLNQVQLAEKLSISKGTVNNWIKGNNSPDVDMVPRICEALDIPVIYLYSSEPVESLIKDQAPATQQGPEDKRVSMEFSTRFLISTGFISEGEQLSDSDLAFLSGIFSLIDAWFSHKR